MNRKFIILAIALVLGVLTLSFILQSLKNPRPREEHHHREKSREENMESAVYACPMHPEIRQNKPGHCPICHMKLVKVENNKDQRPSSKQVNFNLNVSPYQADLIGIKPVEVVKEKVTHSIPVSGRIVSSSSVALQVYQSDLRYIKPGVPFTGHGEIYPEDTISGQIFFVDQFADPSSRTVRVVGRIHGDPRGLLPEASFSGQVKVDLGEKLVVPADAVLSTGNGSFVYLYEGEKLTPQRVTLGPRAGDFYVVIEGLDVGSMISSGPNFLIDSEAKIRGLNDQSHH